MQHSHIHQHTHTHTYRGHVTRTHTHTYLITHARFLTISHRVSVRLHEPWSAHTFVVMDTIMVYVSAHPHTDSYRVACTVTDNKTSFQCPTGAMGGRE